MPTAEPLIADPRQLLLDMAGQQSVAALLDLVVRRLAESPRVALARVWLLLPDDACELCRSRRPRPDSTPALHLLASAGRSRGKPRKEWTRTGGTFHRFAVGERKVGEIAQSGRPLEVPDVDANA